MTDCMELEAPGRESTAASPSVYPDLDKIREALHALEAKYKDVFENIHEMRFVVNLDGRLLDVNPAGVVMFGYESKEEMLREESVSEFFHIPEVAELLQRRVEEEGFIKDFEVEMKRRDGSRFIGCICVHLWFNGDAAGCEWVVRDVTERRQWQMALLESEKHNRELTESQGRIQQLNEHILHMLMVVSHDIRGPLVAIAATLKLLIRGSYGNMDQSVLNTLNDLLSRVKQLIGIAEDCLGKAHSVEGSFKLERERLDLRQDIIDPVLDEVSNDIQNFGIMIDNRLGAIPAGTIPVHVNKMWLKTVFRNLFKNAIKYGGKGCRIAFGFEDHGSYYRLNVYNSGTPIPEEHRDKLFTKFGRIETAGNRAPDGVGLGLYLIREIIQKHGGDIWYEARPDGSDFILTLAKEDSAGPA